MSATAGICGKLIILLEIALHDREVVAPSRFWVRTKYAGYVLKAQTSTTSIGHYDSGARVQGPFRERVSHIALVNRTVHGWMRRIGDCGKHLVVATSNLLRKVVNVRSFPSIKLRSNNRPGFDANSQATRRRSVVLGLCSDLVSN